MSWVGIESGNTGRSYHKLWDIENPCTNNLVSHGSDLKVPSRDTAGFRNRDIAIYLVGEINSQDRYIGSRREVMVKMKVTGIRVESDRDTKSSVTTTFPGISEELYVKQVVRGGGW